MKLVKLFGLLTVLATAAVLVAVYAPPARGQERGAPQMRVLAGRGAEIGVVVRDEPAGVTVDEVRPDSAADKGGLKRADVIVEFDGERVRSARQFSRLVQETAAGRTVNATVLRDAQRRELQILVPETRRADLFLDADRLRDRLGDLGDRLPPFNFNFDFDLPEIASGRRLGVSVQPLTDQLSAYFGVKEGVLVASVTDGSPASRAGVRAGDVITSINGQPVASREDLLRAVRDATNDRIDLGLVRDRQTRTITVTIESQRRRGWPGVI